VYAGGTSEQSSAYINNIPNMIQTSSTSNSQDEISRDMNTLERLYRYLDAHYLYDIDEDKAYEAMATALFDSLDEDYTYYVSSSDKADYVEDTSGVYAGIGVYFSKILPEYSDPENPDTFLCNITQVFPETPSSRAGIKAGDMITAINGESVNDLTPTECANIMKGDPGTDVTLTLRRANNSFDIKLIREIITVPTVENTIINEKTGYLRILQFTQSTTQAAFDSLLELKNDNITSLIIDLRDNGGGDIDVALNIADMFISDKKLLTIKYKDPEDDITYQANSQTLIDTDIPVVILVNGGTASSSEILTGALKDDNRATVIGNTTYGKGIMQLVAPFDKGYVSITTANFLPPGGEVIHKKGIEPDITVEVPVIDDEHFQSYSDLVNSGDIKKWVDEHPENTSENIDSFVLSNQDSSLSDEILKILIRAEYNYRQSDDNRIIADVEYDNVLKRAVTFINTGK